jgi:hypothetical protein
MIFESCRKCGLSYCISQFIPPSEEVSEAEPANVVTQAQWDKLKQKYPYTPEKGAEYAYWCEFCTLEEIELLEP